MARQVNGPWYRAGKNAWYATVDGKSISLGVKGKRSQKQAQDAWHRLMANPTPKPKPELLTVRQLADAFLADAQARLKAPTMRLYRLHLATLCKSLGGVEAVALKPQTLSHWLARLKLSNTTKAMMLRSVSACFGWGEGNGMLPTNPAKKVPKPKSRSRSAEAIVSDTDHAKMLALASPTFHPMLRVLHGTGCRPGEACRITGEAFDSENGVIHLEEHKADATGKPRLIFLPDDLCELLKSQMERFGQGFLLRTGKGKPWNAQSINLQVRRLAKRVGIKAMPYGYRHGFATAALVNGIPDAQVAALLGHSGTAMLHKHYSHLTAQAQAMREAVAKVRA
jgi:integrase/recombinase XerC